MLSNYFARNEHLPQGSPLTTSDTPLPIQPGNPSQTSLMAHPLLNTHAHKLI